MTLTLVAPRVGQYWVHKNGNLYKVLDFSNVGTTQPEKYPHTVIYRNAKNKSLFTRPLADWHRSMTFMGYDDEETCTALDKIVAYSHRLPW